MAGPAAPAPPEVATPPATPVVARAEQVVVLAVLAVLTVALAAGVVTASPGFSAAVVVDADGIAGEFRVSVRAGDDGHEAVRLRIRLQAVDVPRTVVTFSVGAPIVGATATSVWVAHTRTRTVGGHAYPGNRGLRQRQVHDRDRPDRRPRPEPPRQVRSRGP